MSLIRVVNLEPSVIKCLRMRIIKPIKKGKRANRDQREDDSGLNFDIIDSRDVDLGKLDSSDTVAPATSKRRKKRGTYSFEAKRSEAEFDDFLLESQVAPKDDKKEYNRLLGSGFRLLAMREHSVKEIHDKLSRKSEFSDIVNAVLDELITNKYVSDQRFTESYIRMRSNRGFGPVKIRAELKDKGVSNELVVEYLDIGSPIWIDNAVAQYQKKYGTAGVSDYNAWTKRARFMQSRGFTMEHIRIALPEIEFD